MRNLTLIFLIITLFACNRNTKKSELQKEKFEKILDKQETTNLNEIVGDLDKYLIKNYPEQPSKFKAYLNDVSELNLGEYWRPDSIKMKKYIESNLFGKYETIYPDSVWFDGRSFNIKYPDFDMIEEIIPLKRINKENNSDSIINLLRIEPRFLSKKESDFYLALDSIQQSDSLIIAYLNAKEANGSLSPSILANGLKYYLTESNKYLAKRIFVMEMYERRIITVANNKYSACHNW